MERGSSPDGILFPSSTPAHSRSRGFDACGTLTGAGALLPRLKPMPWPDMRFGVHWWSRGGSNSRPSHCERDALPAELRPLRKPAVPVNFTPARGEAPSRARGPRQIRSDYRGRIAALEHEFAGSCRCPFRRSVPDWVAIVSSDGGLGGRDSRLRGHPGMAGCPSCFEGWRRWTWRCGGGSLRRAQPAGGRWRSC